MKKSLGNKSLRVLLNYFPNKKDCVFLSKLQNRDNVFLIELNSKKYVLKKYKTGKNIDTRRVTFFGDLQNFTNNKLGLLPQVIKTTKQKLCVKQDKEIFQITEYLDNKDVNKRDISKHDGFFYDIGVMVSKIHNALTEYERNNKVHYRALLKFYPNDPSKHLLKLLSQYKKQNIGDKYQKILKAKIKIVDGYNVNQDTFQKLPIKIVHGDLHVYNLLFDKKFNIIGLVDYTKAGLFFRCYEVIRAFVQTNKYLGNLLVNPLDLKKYLKGYCRFSQLNQDEVSTMLDLYIFIQATDSSFLKVKDFKNDNKSSLEYGLYRFKSLKHLIKNRESLIKIIHESQ